MSKNPKRAVSAFLIILYSLIGITGESAHYCFQQSFSLEACIANHVGKGSETPSSVFHHRHAPGDHWHFHPVEKEQADSQENTGPQESTGTNSPLFASSTNFHNDHACPLLSILRLLELGAGGQASLLSRLAITSQLIEQEQSSVTLQDRSQLHVRGPPLSILA